MTSSPGLAEGRPAAGDEARYQAWYAITAALFLALAGWQLLSPLRLNWGGADIWQHLAALNAIIESPADPRNPFVDMAEPSRLFGPYWVLVGTIARLAGAEALHALVAASIVSVTLWLGAIYLFGRAWLGSAKGALVLLLTLTLAWIWPPSFTGYHSPIAIITGAAFPAFLLMGLTLLLWALSIRLLERGEGVIGIGLLTAFMTATHPFGAAVALAGAAAFALLAERAATRERQKLAAALAGGAALALVWPYYSVIEMLGGAGSAAWGTGANFYTVRWLAESLVPAIFGLAGLLNRRSWPLLALLALCAAGFLLGLTERFAAGHRLLPYITLILHIGLAQLILTAWSNRPMRLPIVGFAVLLAILQLHWTAGTVIAMRGDMRANGDLLSAARALTADIPSDAVIAGETTASFPVAANGRRVLSTPFAEPMVTDLAERQADSAALFDPSKSAAERSAIARRRGVSYLIVDVRTASPETLRMLASEASEPRRAGELVRYRIRPDQPAGASR